VEADRSYAFDVAAPMSYVLCATPRTGSTFLCSLLSSTGVAGRPESYLRDEDWRLWAERFGMPALADRSEDYPPFVAGAVRAGSTHNGVFGARLMWGTMPVLVRGLDPCQGRRSDHEVLADALGPLCFVHLQRHDVVGQAVSWARAEQSGYWQHGDQRTGEPRFDLDQLDELVRTIDGHNAAWRHWFVDQGVEPVNVAYESVVAAPSDTVRVILHAIGTELPAGWTPASSHQRQADNMNAEWVQRYHAVRGLSHNSKVTHTTTSDRPVPVRHDQTAPWHDDAGRLRAVLARQLGVSRQVEGSVEKIGVLKGAVGQLGGHRLQGGSARRSPMRPEEPPT
jgi:LPS sulfotransferase NodH